MSSHLSSKGSCGGSTGSSSSGIDGRRSGWNWISSRSRNRNRNRSRITRHSNTVSSIEMGVSERTITEVALGAPVESQSIADDQRNIDISRFGMKLNPSNPACPQFRRGIVSDS